MPTKAELQASLDAMQAKVYELQDAIVALTKASDDALKRLSDTATIFENRSRAIAKAIDARFIRDGDDRYIVLPMSDEEQRAVEGLIRDAVSEHWCEGTVVNGHYDPGNETEVSGWEQAFSNDYFYRKGKPLPQWDGYYVAYEYSRDDGPWVYRIWGLKEIK